MTCGWARVLFFLPKNQGIVHSAVKVAVAIEAEAPLLPTVWDNRLRAWPWDPFIFQDSLREKEKHK